MRVVVALGGNALALRGETITAENQRRNVRVAAAALAPLARDHTLVITHGNGPQVGLLALQAASYEPAGDYPLDVLGAESEGMVGYLIEQELRSLLPDSVVATLLTMVEVDAKDPAFDHPTKPIGPVYTLAEAERISTERGWIMKQIQNHWRRVVASPEPRRVIQLPVIRWLLEHDAIVICAGGGGIPTVRGHGGTLRGVDAVIDKDRASAVLAEDLEADVLILATDVDAVFSNWAEPGAEAIRQTDPETLASLVLDPGSMGPKVESACRFVRDGGRGGRRRAVIGALGAVESMLAGSAGTQVVIER